MIDLNNLEEIKKLDPKDVFGSTSMLADQCADIWELAKAVDFSKELGEAEHIILCGMGGSRYGGYIIPYLFRETLRVPFYAYGDYHLPGFASKKNLFILASYSGGTEEPLSSAAEAINNGIPIVGLTSGGQALEMSQEHNFPSLVFSQKYNPSGQPRLGTGYMVFGVIALLTRLGYLSLSDAEITNVIGELRKNTETIQMYAKDAAKKIVESIPVYFAAEFLTGNIHILRNQTNETAKSFAAYSPLPELNHHLMEGLKNPPDKKLIVLFITSDLYSDVLKKRTLLTQDVVAKNNIAWAEYKAQGSTKLSQMLNVLSFGGYLSLYLALLYGQDPSVIPWVDYFKEQLAK